MAGQILYEQPLNERIRIFLRLEHFFAQISHFLRGSEAKDTEAAIASLIEILMIIERSDIRFDVLKEMERHIFALSKLMESPGVDKSRLDITLDKLTTQVQNLQKTPNKLTAELKENELLNSIRQRTLISAGTCGFDLPAYHYLLNQTAGKRHEHITRWLNDLLPLREGIELLLTMVRNSALFERQVSENGFFQKSLDTQNPCQLVRLQVCSNTEIYPEVSGSKHRVNVRFLTFSEVGRPKQIEFPQEFEISCCAI